MHHCLLCLEKTMRRVHILWSCSIVVTIGDAGGSAADSNSVVGSVEWWWYYWCFTHDMCMIIWFVQCQLSGYVPVHDTVIVYSLSCRTSYVYHYCMLLELILLDLCIWCTMCVYCAMLSYWICCRLRHWLRWDLCMFLRCLAGWQHQLWVDIMILFSLVYE